MIVVQTRDHPILSKAEEVRSLIDATLQSQPAGGRVALSRTMFGELPVLVLSELHDDFGAYESARDARFSNPD